MLFFWFSFFLMVFFFLDPRVVGGTNIFTYNNLLIKNGWNLKPTPDSCGSFNNTYVDSPLGGMQVLLIVGE